MGAMYQARTSAAGLSDLVKLVSEQAGRPIVVAEVGSFRGESARIMLATGAVSRVYCIDPWVAGYDPDDIASRQDMSAVEDDFDRRIGGDPRVVKCKGDIVDFASRYSGVAVDLVYIDGKHTYDAVVRDIGVALGRIKPVVAVSGHDYNGRVHAGVCRAVDELLGGPQRVFSDRSWVVFRDGSGVAVADSGKGMAMSGNTGSPPMWDMFDAVAVLCSTDYQHRIPSLREELSRVGLLDRVEWFWDFDNPFMVRLANNLRLSGDIRNMGGFRLTMNHYRAVKTFSELGYKHVLVLEDDVRFLRDTDALASVLRSMPADYDMAKLEWTAHPTRGARSVPDINGPWCPLSGFDTYCAAAIAYSDKGMKWRAGKIEEAADYANIFAELHMVDVYDNSPSVAGLRAYVAAPLAAVQNWTGDGVHRQNKGTYKLYGSYLAAGGVGAYAVGG